jgi:hypothetical protein
VYRVVFKNQTGVLDIFWYWEKIIFLGAGANKSIFLYYVMWMLIFVPQENRQWGSATGYNCGATPLSFEYDKIRRSPILFSRGSVSKGVVVG